MVVESTSPAVEAQQLLATLLAFLGDLWATPLVHSVRINAAASPIDLWVILDHEDVPVMKSHPASPLAAFRAMGSAIHRPAPGPARSCSAGRTCPPGQAIFERGF